MPNEVVAQVLRKPYARVIIPDDTGRYAAQVLEFPGCLSEGATPDEAYSNLQEAAENWVDAALSQGMAIPEPSATQGYSGTVSLRLPRSIHKRAAQYARRDGISLNQFLVSAIAARVGAEDAHSWIAAKLDDYLYRLQTRRVSLPGLKVEQHAITGGTPAPLWLAMILDQMHAASPTSSATTLSLHGKEPDGA